MRKITVWLLFIPWNSLNLRVKITQCQCLVEYFYIAITLQENNTPENQTNTFSREGNSSKLTK